METFYVKTRPYVKFSQYIKVSEHVQVQVDLTFPRRGYLEMISVSPSGTQSGLLYPRVIDSGSGLNTLQTGQWLAYITGERETCWRVEHHIKKQKEKKKLQTR